MEGEGREQGASLVISMAAGGTSCSLKRNHHGLGEGKERHVNRQEN